MKLELKHIAPYLPYGICWKFESEDFTQDVIGLDITHEGVKLESPYYDFGSCSLNEGQPILRPLSSMTKEEFSELKSKLDDGVLLKLTPNGDIYIKCNDEIYLYEVNILNDFLFSNHFDVFDLIDNGLAIDKNNLK